LFEIDQVRPGWSAGRRGSFEESLESTPQAVAAMPSSVKKIKMTVSPAKIGIGATFPALV
jgi:hypothetical protein